jgi:hypothetical protein
MRCALISYGSGYGPIPGYCEDGNGTFGFIRGGKFREWLSDC